MAKRTVLGLLTAIAILLFWTTQAAWGRSVVNSARYKFDLTGVAKISNPHSQAEVRDHCNWYESPATRRHCATAHSGAEAYRLLKLAPAAAALSIISLLAIAWIFARHRLVARGTLPLIALAGALAMFCAIQLLTRNIARAIAIYAGQTLEVRGSGLVTAWLVVLLFAATAALTSEDQSAKATARNN